MVQFNSLHKIAGTKSHPSFASRMADKPSPDSGYLKLMGAIFGCPAAEIASRLKKSVGTSHRMTKLR